MRWDRLFDDLEAQLAAEGRLERDAEVADRTRAERGKVGLTDHLVGGLGEEVVVRLVGGRSVSGALSDVGDGWFVVAQGSRRVLVATGAVVDVVGLPGRPRGSVSARRFGIGLALREISRDRSPVALHDITGGVLHGTVDSVGGDMLVLGEHALDEPRRAGNVRSRRMVSLAAIAMVVPG